MDTKTLKQVFWIKVEKTADELYNLSRDDLLDELDEITAEAQGEFNPNDEMSNLENEDARYKLAYSKLKELINKISVKEESMYQIDPKIANVKLSEEGRADIRDFHSSTKGISKSLVESWIRENGYTTSGDNLTEIKDSSLKTVALYNIVEESFYSNSKNVDSLKAEEPRINIPAVVETEDGSMFREVNTVEEAKSTIEEFILEGWNKEEIIVLDGFDNVINLNEESNGMKKKITMKKLEAYCKEAGLTLTHITDGRYDITDETGYVHFQWENDIATGKDSEFASELDEEQGFEEIVEEKITDSTMIEIAREFIFQDISTEEFVTALVDIVDEEKAESLAEILEDVNSVSAIAAGLHKVKTELEDAKFAEFVENVVGIPASEIVEENHINDANDEELEEPDTDVDFEAIPDGEDLENDEWTEWEATKAKLRKEQRAKRRGEPVEEANASDDNVQALVNTIIGLEDELEEVEDEKDIAAINTDISQAYGDLERLGFTIGMGQVAEPIKVQEEELDEDEIVEVEDIATRIHKKLEEIEHGVDEGEYDDIEDHDGLEDDTDIYLDEEPVEEDNNDSDLQAQIDKVKADIKHLRKIGRGNSSDVEDLEDELASLSAMLDDGKPVEENVASDLRSIKDKISEIKDDLEVDAAVDIEPSEFEIEDDDEEIEIEDDDEEIEIEDDEETVEEIKLSESRNVDDVVQSIIDYDGDISSALKKAFSSEPDSDSIIKTLVDSVEKYKKSATDARRKNIKSNIKEVISDIGSGSFIVALRDALGETAYIDASIVEEDDEIELIDDDEFDGENLDIPDQDDELDINEEDFASLLADAINKKTEVVEEDEEIDVEDDAAELDEAIDELEIEEPDEEEPDEEEPASEEFEESEADDAVIANLASGFSIAVDKKNAEFPFIEDINETSVTNWATQTLGDPEMLKDAATVFGLPVETCKEYLGDVIKNSKALSIELNNISDKLVAETPEEDQDVDSEEIEDDFGSDEETEDDTTGDEAQDVEDDEDFEDDEF